MERTKVYGYVRVSTDQQDNSIEVQVKRIGEYCLFKSLDLVEIYIDENVSGFSQFANRPEGGKLISLLNTDVKAIVSVKPDRLFRNTSDALITVDSWDKMGIELHLIDIGGSTLATKTAMGKMLFTVLIAFSQFERDVTGERIKAVLNSKKSSGKVYTGSIFGYDKMDGLLIKNEVEQLTLGEIFRLKDSYAPCRIARILNSTGFRTKNNKRFHPSTIQNIIKNQIHKAA